MNTFRTLGVILLLAVGTAQSAWAQGSVEPIAKKYLLEHQTELGLSQADIENWVITDSYTSSHNQVQHLYIRQTHQDIEIFNAVANFNIWQGRVMNMGDRLERNVATRINTVQPSLTPFQAIEAAANHLGLTATEPIAAIQPISTKEFLFNKAGLSLREIPVKLMYQPMPEGEILLAWNVTILMPNGQHWWNMRIDANTGALLQKNDWISQCDFDDPLHLHNFVPTTNHKPAGPAHTLHPEHSMMPAQYRVIPTPFESPNHGPDSLVTDPADAIASPFGWHDTDGVAGAEYTITRGNNVFAYEDRDADNNPGFSPDGGPNLVFDYPYNLNQPAPGYQDASVTNLFYWNNLMHDVWYHYGFDEASGNFQTNNYGNGGLGNDEVEAEAQDGGGTNNANFGTPGDGQNPRMQMFLWTAGGANNNLLDINSPSVIAGNYTAVDATFGPGVPTTPITQDLVLVEDGTNPDVNDACDAITNAAAINGKIAFIRRGNCTFVSKVEAAQNAGAVAVIVWNNTGGAPFGMGGASNTITIPSVMISLNDGNAILAEINAGNTVNGTLVNANPTFDRDGDFDNGVIAHEYTHGISNRLTGGGNNASCLFGAEQMGEGWSDWYGLMVTLDTNFVNRGIGTYAAGQPTNGTGIRPAQYSPSTAINNFTYASTNFANQTSQPHGIGFVWATMLWDMTLMLIDQYGFDPNIYTGTGGNNIAMQLVTDGLKLQPCNPGFVDGRDAILMADSINYGGANQCLIWEAFAARGLGFSANQGSPGSRTDQVEAFDLPPICLTPVSSPSAAFSVQIIKDCRGEFTFDDNSTDVPQTWDWDFGDGNTSNQQEPTHTYAASGVYTVRLIVTNTIGSDTTFQTVVVSLPAEPTAADITYCPGGNAAFNASSNGTTYWYDGNQQFLATGDLYLLFNLNNDTSLFAQNVIEFPPQNVGPLTGSIGGGGYHSTGFTGTLNFEAFQEVTIVSAWLDAGSAGPRTIYLWDGPVNSGVPSGNIIDSVELNIPAGPQRVTLDLEVPGPGQYSVGGTSIDLFRNNAGVNFPYAINGLISINSSSASTSAGGFYYYLYDWEVQEKPCFSPLKEVKAEAAEADFSLNQTSGSDVTFTDLSTNANSWEWDFGDGNTSTQQSPSYSYTASGIYVITLTINGICTHTDTVSIIMSSLEDLSATLSVELIPNPAVDQVQLEFSQVLDQSYSLQMIGMDGKIVQQQQLQAGTQTKSIALDGLAAGIYLVRIANEKAQMTLKLVVQP